MKWYRVSWWAYGGRWIEEVDVEKETASFLVIKGRRWAKRSSSDNYFPSFEEAKTFALHCAKARVEGHEADLSRARQALEEIQQLSTAEG